MLAQLRRRQIGFLFDAGHGEGRAHAAQPAFAGMVEFDEQADVLGVTLLDQVAEPVDRRTGDVEFLEWASHSAVVLVAMASATTS